MRLIFILLGIPLIYICCSCSKTSDYEQLIDRKLSKFVNHVEQKYQLGCSGSGGSCMGNIKMIAFAFRVTGSKSLEEMRKLMVYIAEDFLDMINNDLNIREYLANYPFTANNLNFSITLFDKINQSKPITNKGNLKDLICNILLINGKIIYSIQNEDKLRYQTVFRESYEDAYKIVYEKP